MTLKYYIIYCNCFKIIQTFLFTVHNKILKFLTRFCLSEDYDKLHFFIMVWKKYFLELKTFLFCKFIFFYFRFVEICFCFLFYLFYCFLLTNTFSRTYLTLTYNKIKFLFYLKIRLFYMTDQCTNNFNFYNNAKNSAQRTCPLEILPILWWPNPFLL